MATMEPQQMLFGSLLESLQEMGYDVYDGALPPDGVPYPFIYLADSQMIDESRKGAVQGTVYQTIHVWHNNPRQRGTVSGIMLDIKNLCRKLENEDHWVMSSCDSRILAEDLSGGGVTQQPLVHGIIEVGMKF